jgi:hypothetical protein
MFTIKLVWSGVPKEADAKAAIDITRNLLIVHGMKMSDVDGTEMLSILKRPIASIQMVKH